MIMRKYSQFIVYILAAFVAVYVNYLIRKSVGLSIDIFTLLIPLILGGVIVWLYGQIKKKKK